MLILLAIVVRSDWINGGKKDWISDLSKERQWYYRRYKMNVNRRKRQRNKVKERIVRKEDKRDGRRNERHEIKRIKDEDDNPLNTLGYPDRLGGMHSVLDLVYSTNLILR